MFLFDLIIPAYNSKSTIARLLKSITQNECKDEIRIFIVDDNSTESYKEEIEPFHSELEIYIVSTGDYSNIHCPGNTREVGLQYVSSPWICFCDHDDYFFEGAFDKVKAFISAQETEPYVVSSGLVEINPETNESLRSHIGEKADTWLHGKWYNREKCIEAFDIHFKKDLFSHEDVYFNSLVLANIVAAGGDYAYLDEYTYVWVYNPNSLSRSYYSTKHNYIETYLNDYLIATTEPFFENNKKENSSSISSFNLHQIMMGLLHGYFYYQAAVCQLGSAAIKENRMYLSNLIEKIETELLITKEEIIHYLYNNPKLYHSLKEGTFASSGYFIEKESLSDFIHHG